MLLYFYVMQAEIDVLKDLHRHCKMLAKAPDPRRRIAASQWEIFFEEKLAEAERSEPQMQEAACQP